MPRPRRQWAEERAHAELIGESQGLLVVRFSVPGVHGIAMQGDLAQNSETPRLGGLSLVVAREIEGLTGELDRVPILLASPAGPDKLTR